MEEFTLPLAKSEELGVEVKLRVRRFWGGLMLILTNKHESDNVLLGWVSSPATVDEIASKLRAPIEQALMEAERQMKEGD